MCSTCERFEERNRAGNVGPPWGRSSVGRALAWHARGFVGSSPIASTFFQMHESIGATLGGIVAGEGCFCVSSRGDNFVRDGSARLRFIFTVTMASRDRPILEALHQFLGAGRRTDRETRAGCLPTSVFDIRSEKVHTGVVIPFAERFLP